MTEIEFPTNPRAWVSQSHLGAFENKEMGVASITL